MGFIVERGEGLWGDDEIDKRRVESLKLFERYIFLLTKIAQGMRKISGNRMK